MAAEKPNQPGLRLRVTAAAESVLRGGHPWLFADSIREQNREGRAGELAVVYDRRDRFLAIGLYDPESPIRLRVLHAGKPVAIDEAWWRGRWRAAFDRRAGLFDAQTTGYRCIHGENDGWPGLVLDRYGSVAVLKFYTASWLPRLPDLAALVAEEFQPGRLVLRLSRNIQSAARHCGLEDGAILDPKGKLNRPAWDGIASFLESGLQFEADVVRGQKTGFFLDQRENRRRVEAQSAGREVLNAFSFSGGFSVYAARGGARSVADLDISEHALAAARRNFSLNASDPRVARCRHETVQADAFDWLERDPGRTFDLVILDPPSLARRETERAGAIRAYANLARAGLRVLRPGGVLVACSCSAHVTAEEFFGAVRAAATAAGRQVEEQTITHEAPDHPATFAEGRYLKAIFLKAVS